MGRIKAVGVASLSFAALLLAAINTAPADAATTRHRAVGPPVVAVPGANPTSDALIDQAIASGSITAEQGLIYKVFAAYEDPRLPANLKGDDSQRFDSLIIGDVAAVYDKLSPEAQATLAPFLIPPMYKQSWYEQRLGGNSLDPSIQSVHSLTIGCDLDTAKWNAIPCKVAPVVVWYQKVHPEDKDRSQALADEIDRWIWPRLSSLLAPHKPLPDQGSASSNCQGIDSNLDIALIDGKTTSTNPYAVFFRTPPTPAYILLSRVADDKDFATTAHEMMHAFQYSYNEMDRWMMEAFAEWGQAWVYNNPLGDTGKEFRSVPLYLYRTNESLLLEDGKHDYGAYLFPFFLEHQYYDETIVPKIYNAITGQEFASIDAIDSVISDHGGLAKVFPAFAVAAWNKVPFNSFDTWDNMTMSPADQQSDGAQITKANLGKGADFTNRLFEGAPYPALSIRYADFTFTDDTTRSFTFWNGFTFNVEPATFADKNGAGTEYHATPLSADETKGLKVQALVKINGVWEQTPRDLTNEPYVSFCRDTKAERLDEIVLIFSNSNTQGGWIPSNKTNNNLGPFVSASNIGCYQYQGTIHTLSTNGGTRTESTATVTWERVSAPAGAVLRQTDFKPKSGSLTFQNTESGPECPLTGSGTIPIDTSSATNVLSLYSFIPGGTGNIPKRAITALAQTIVTFHDCKGAPKPIPLPWGVIPPADPSTKKAFTVGADGTAQGIYHGANVEIDWNFTPVKE